MDLSKTAKKKRDQVEEPLFLLEKLLDELEECRTRIDATMKVWPETSRTLRPALSKQDLVSKRLKELQAKLSFLWKRGFATKWKER